MSSFASPSSRVIVVGAGVSGLTTARILIDSGIDVVVLEAREFTGGRLHSQKVAEACADMGAGWLEGLSRANPVFRCVKHQKKSISRAQWGELIYDDAFGEYVDEDDADRSWQVGEDSFTKKLDALRAKLPEESSVADGVSLFLSSGPYSHLRATEFVINLSTQVDYAAQAERMSLKWYDEEESFEGGQGLCDGGYTNALIPGLCEGLDIRHSQGVTAIRQSETGVRVDTCSDSWEGSACVVTVPLGCLKARTIAFSPPLSARRLEAMDRLEMATLNRVILGFEERWWADTPISKGAFFMSKNPGELPLWIDLSDQMGTPTLLGLEGADRAVESEGRSDEERIAEALKVVEKMSGREPPKPAGAAVTSWHSDVFARGSYSFAPVGSSPDDFDRLGGREGERIYFAGEHTAFGHHGTVNGAMLSGVRVAEELGGNVNNWWKKVGKGGKKKE